MRVVAGTAGGRRLVAPEGRSTRPTPDRVREAIFNALGSLGAVEGADVLDLFAGSGAMGVEALSRGAAHATFVDEASAARHAVRTNLDRCGLAGRAEVVGVDAHRFVADAAAEGRWWDVAFLDPPYRYDGWAELLGALPCALAVVESDRELRVPDDWERTRSRRYGRSHVTFAARRPS